VECDCTRAPQQETLMLGDLSAFISDRTRELHVKNCESVDIQSQALSQAVSLEKLQLSNIGILNLQPLSMYTNKNPARSVMLTSIAQLMMQPAAFDQVTVLEQLMLDHITTDTLPAELFGLRTDIIDFTMARSNVQVVENLRLPKADAITVDNCTIGELNMDIVDVLKVNITRNMIDSVGVLKFNVQPTFHSNDNKSVYLSENQIVNMTSDSMEMIVDNFYMTNNTVSELTGPLRVNFAEAQITGNTFEEVSPASFAAMRQLDALTIRMSFGRNQAPARHALVFADNFMMAPAGNSTFQHLLRPDDLTETNTLFHLYNNRFQCGCGSLRELVEAGDRAFLAAANMTEEDQDDDPVVPVEELARELYTTSACEDGRPLSQFRLTAYDSQYMCQTGAPKQNNSATAAAAGLLTMATAAAGVAVLLI